MSLTGVANKTEFSSTAVIPMPLWKNMSSHTQLLLVIIDFSEVTFFTPQNMHCLIL